MRKTNLFLALIATVVILSIGSGCSSLLGSKTENNSAKASETEKAADTPDQQNPADSKEKTEDKPKAEKADFTVTAEELDKEFTRKGVTDKDLEKYASKNIAVTGRVSMLVTEKKGTTQPWVTLFAPGILHGVSCYFDDDNVEQMKLLKMDKKAKVQGFQSDFIVPEISPRLEHCVVLEAD
jgi:hypothetical protein